MRIRPATILLLLLIPVVSHTQSLSDYLGHYVVPKENRRGIHRFHQFDLLQDTSGANSFHGIAIFLSDTTVSPINDLVFCPTRDIVLMGDSLIFRTTDCANERYEFAGRFVRKPKPFDEEFLTPVLEGTLTHYSGNRLLSRNKVLFRYDEGC